MKSVDLQTVQAISTSNGFIEAYIVNVSNEPDWVIPQKIVIHVEQSALEYTTYPYQEQELPILDLSSPEVADGVILVIESSDVQKRLVLRVDAMPVQKRFRISNLRDYDDPSCEHLPYLFQPVLLDGVIMQVPSFDKIESQLFPVS